MKQICLLCGRTSPDNNLFCQETYCPAEMSPVILDYGEWLGDIEIVKPVMVLRSAVLYEATHQKQKVFLKVAHPGLENKERLKREAEFLRAVQLAKENAPYLPTLLPPYVGVTIKDDAIGKTMLNNHLLYFYLFEHKKGEPLRDVLLKNPQLWVNHIGWITISLAYAVAFLHSKGVFHFGLSPDVVLVDFDENVPSVPRVLLFDLGIASLPKQLGANWYPFFVPPAYTAPELLERKYGTPGYATDVYGVGMILYEMLAGKPAIPYKLLSDEDVYQAVRKNRRIKMNRLEDVRHTANVAIMAVKPSGKERQQSVNVLAQQLIKQFGHVPPSGKNRWPGLNTILIIVAALLATAFLIALAVSIGNFGG